MSKVKFGTIRKLPSGRWQARYTDPDGRLRSAPTTFDTKGAANTYLATVRADMVRGLWEAPKPKIAPLTFGDYSASWLEHRKLEARTRADYRRLLDRLTLPTFASVPLRDITPDMVRAWYATTAVSTPTLRAHAYGLLRTILTSAEREDLITRNPCHIRGAGNAKRAHKVEPASLAELETITVTMPERLQLMLLMAAWCALRFGELAELRRGDVDTKRGVVRVRRGVVRVDGEKIVKGPKSDAGSRDVAIPPHLVPLVREHLLRHTQPGRDGLLFPARSGGQLAPSTLYRHYYRARDAAGRPDLHFHDLRHTGAVLAAQTGATLAELMGRLGHSTPGAAMRYQHAARDRDGQIAAALSAMVAAAPSE